ncbi:benzoate/H(+) symporter BenE family transporter [Neisseriaceae bacterium TC5R-5]|nr:benzoate/H(+) symporter BenE family transporter [Neisseriaceae bacterium TC5R-5]
MTTLSLKGGLLRFFPHLSAGFIAVLVGYTSSAAIIFQAAHAAGATQEQMASWMWALGLGMGFTCIGLSLATRSPILTAWSTPGAALLSTSLIGVPMSEAIGAFLLASALMVITGLSGGFERLIRLVPKTVAAAMLAGVLFHFGTATFTALAADKLLVLSMMVVFFLGRRWQPRYAIPLTLIAGITIAALAGRIGLTEVHWTLARPVFTMPTFALSTMIGVGIPLFVVTLVSQNVPGLAVLRANGYQTPAAPLISWTGFTSLLLAPFGGFALNLAAITAAICMSKDADPDPAQRYKASIWAGCFYVLIGLFGATVSGLFAAFPQPLILAIAGLALLATIGNSLASALMDESERDAALLTFLVTASGISLFGIGSAFWGLVFGIVVSRLAAKP